MPSLTDPLWNYLSPFAQVLAAVIAAITLLGTCTFGLVRFLRWFSERNANQPANRPPNNMQLDSSVTTIRGSNIAGRDININLGQQPAKQPSTGDKFYVGESLDLHQVNFDYYFMPLDEDHVFAYKVASIAMDDYPELRRTLTLTLVNKVDKPAKVVAVEAENMNREILPLARLGFDSPKILDAFVGDLAVSIVLDQLWALAQVTDKRFGHDFSPLFFLQNLTLDLDTVVFKLVDGRTIRHKVSEEMMTKVREVFNPTPEITAPPSPESQCCAGGCRRRPDYIVLLYDHYSDDTVFFEQDFTCPFLCEDHMRENEHGIGSQGLGERRRPRGRYEYPYSNRGGAQGYSKYWPLNRSN